MSIEGKVALVTGATSGLGRGVAATWAEMGAKVVTAARRTEMGLDLEREVKERGNELVFVTTDVSKAGDCKAAVDVTLQRYGRIDILLNNAGVEGPVGDAHELPEEDWNQVLAINLSGAFFCSKHAIPAMREQGGGVILNVASINAVEAVAHMVAYNASKAGVVQLSRSLAVEYLLDNIRCNAILLGGVEGDTQQRTQEGIGRYMCGPDFVLPPRSDDPMSELLIQKPADVARLLALFCHDDARLLTGATIAIDRGMTAGFTTSMTVHMTTSGLWS